MTQIIGWRSRRTQLLPEVPSSNPAAETPLSRRIAERAPTWRSETQRDRDRILYSPEFRRLSGITQVTTAEVGLAVHHRLIHSLKVAQLARRLAERLQSSEAQPSYAHLERVRALDPDGVEAGALAHDIGHPPFGHVAEDALAEWASGYGGFEGNAQSFRVVTHLAGGPLPDNDFQGLNLTRMTLNGMLKYPRLRSGAGRVGEKYGAYLDDGATFKWVRRLSPVEVVAPPDVEQRSLEAELMDWADDVTYAVHDLEDFYRAGLIPFALLSASQAERTRFMDSFLQPTDERAATRVSDSSDDELRAAESELFERYAPLLRESFDGSILHEAKIRAFSSQLIGRFVGAIDPDTAPTPEKPALLAIDRGDRALVALLKELTWYYVINRPALASIQAAQKSIIKSLCDKYTDASVNKNDWSVFPKAARTKLEQGPGDSRGPAADAARARIILDLVAGLSDAQAYELHRRFMGAIPGSLLAPVAQ